MGSLFSSPKPAAVPALPAMAPPPPTPADKNVAGAGANQAMMANRAAAANSDVATSGQGVTTAAATTRKSLLGD